LTAAAAQYMPFFLTGFFPCFLVLIGMYMNNKRLDQMEKSIHARFRHVDADFVDLKSQIQHFIDLHINHEGRIAAVEERTKRGAA
jgi:hypothetical protein